MAITRASTTFSPTQPMFASEAGSTRSFRRRRIARVKAVGGGFELDGEGPFPHVFLATGHPGLALPDALADDRRVVHAYEPHEYASSRGDRRGGNGGCDRMAKRARGRLRRRVGASPRAVATAAQRPPPALLEARARQRSTDRRASRARRRCGSCRRRRSRPIRSSTPVIAAAAAEGRFRVAAELNGAEQVIAATGFRRGFRHDELLARLVERARSRRARPVARPGERLDRSRTDRRAPHALGRWCRRTVGVSGGRHDRGREVRGPPLPGARVSFTLKGRVQSRLVAALPALLVALAIHRWWAVYLVAAMLVRRASRSTQRCTTD